MKEGQQRGTADGTVRFYRATHETAKLFGMHRWVAVLFMVFSVGLFFLAVKIGGWRAGVMSFACLGFFGLMVVSDRISRMGETDVAVVEVAFEEFFVRSGGTKSVLEVVSWR
ncbi:MAG: hypothetical protein AAGB34_03045 [Planctomycetota bacterium]